MIDQSPLATTDKDRRLIQLQEEIDNWQKIPMLSVRDRRAQYIIAQRLDSSVRAGFSIQTEWYQTTGGDMRDWKIMADNMSQKAETASVGMLDAEDRLKLIKELTLSQDIERIREGDAMTDFLMQNWSEMALQFPRLTPTATRLPSFAHVDIGGRHFNFIGMMPDDSLVAVPEQKIGDKPIREYDTVQLQKEIHDLIHIRPSIQPFNVIHTINRERIPGKSEAQPVHTLMVMAPAGK